ncbi:MAG: hypothetical protein AB1756_04140, partial [Acidobacteriota bacterium]
MKNIKAVFLIVFLLFFHISFPADNEIESLILKSFPVEIDPKKEVSKVLRGNALPLTLNDQVPFNGIPHKFVNTTVGNL